MTRKTRSRLVPFVMLGLLTPAVFNTPSALSATVTRSWVARYEGISTGEDVPRAIALSPDGARVYVTGFSLAGQYISDGARADYATVAYDTSTGAEVWASRYDGPASRWDAANSIAVSPDGGTVFVTGGSRDATRDYATIAYDAATGNVDWSDRFDGDSHQLDSAKSVAVSPDGTTVYVTGYSIIGFTASGNRILRFVTIAYDAATGSRNWIAGYSGAGRSNYAFKALVAPDGGTVFAVGWGSGGHRGPSAEVAAYDATSGSQLWATRHNGPRPGGEAAYDAVVAPNGATVFAAGTSGSGFGTLALDAQTGAVEWAARFSPNGYADADSIAIAPDGSRVFVAGWSGPGPVRDLTAVAYTSSDGTRLWTGREVGAPLGGEQVTVVAGLDGRTVYLAGEGSRSRTAKDFVTVAFRADSGGKRWVRFYDGGIRKGDEANAAAAGAGGQVYVTGDSRGVGGRAYATVAYTRS